MSDPIQLFASKQRRRYGPDFFIEEIPQPNGIKKIVLITSTQQTQLKDLLKQDPDSQQFQVVSMEESEGVELVVRQGFFNLYTKRKEDLSSLADQIVAGERIRVLKEVANGEWIPIAVHHDFEDQAPKELGWIRYDSSKLSLAINNPGQKFTPQFDLNKFEQLVDQYVSKNSGIKYLLGGKSEESGFDCSGFTYLIVRQLLGVALPGISRWQALVGQQVSLDQIRPGDLIYFTEVDSRVSHDGLVYQPQPDKLPIIVHCAKWSNGIVVEDLNQVAWLDGELQPGGFRRIAR